MAHTDGLKGPQTTAITAGVLGKLLLMHGLPVSKGALAEACNTMQPEDAELPPAERLMGILRAVQKNGVQVVQLRWSRLDQRHLPVLVWHGGKWQIASHGSGRMVTLAGEKGGAGPVPVAELADAPVLWLRVQAPDLAAGEVLKSGAAQLLLQEALHEKRWLVEVIVATAAVNLLAVAGSLFSMQVYDRVVPTMAYTTLTALSVGMAIVVAVDWMLKHIRARIVDTLAKQVDLAVSQRLFEHVMGLRLDARPRSLGSLAAQMSGLEPARGFFSSTIVFALADLPFCLLFIGLIAAIGGRVSIVYLVLLVIALVWGWVAQKQLRRLARQEITRGHERHGLLVEMIQGAETIQAAGAGWRFAELWRTITATMGAHALQSRTITSTTLTTTGTLGTLAYVAAIVVGVTRIEAGDLTTGGLIACTILGGRVIAPIAQGVQLQVQWYHVRESLAMVNRLLALETGRPEDGSLLAPETLTDRLDLEGVRFAYPNSPVMRLQLPELHFAAGDRVVLLGPNGCGKSTLLKVAAGLYRPSEGQVRLGGADIWELDSQVINERIGYLPQDIHLFKGTLKSNLLLGGGASDGKLLEVAQLLGIDRIAADNPRSMELEISEGGTGLSGGQRQLVGLARLFLAQPRVWLLDEPTSSLDLESENRIIEALREAVRPTDILLIATHRPRLAVLANRVILMGRGRVIADGKPEEVLQQQPRRGRRLVQTVGA